MYTKPKILLLVVVGKSAEDGGENVILKMIMLLQALLCLCFVNCSIWLLPPSESQCFANVLLWEVRH